MHFKNYKSSKLYILLNLIHLISIPTTSLQFIMHHGMGITNPFLISLSPLSRFARCPTTPRAPTPPPSPQHAPALGPPRRLRQLARRHDSRSHLPYFPLSFSSMHGHSTFVYTRQMKQDKAPTEVIFTFTIYHSNKQGTQATCIYHQHAKHKQTSVSSTPTHAHIQIANACMQIRHRPPCKVRHRPFAC
jgi:hypothetical protein